MNNVSVPATQRDRATAAEAWWCHPGVMVVFMAMSTFPMWFVATPPLIDFLGHIARYHVALDVHTNSILARNWDYSWALIGNLGVDLLIMPLARLIGLEPAAWAVAAMLPPLMIWGLFRASKAVYGAVSATAIIAMPFALAYPYQYGFVNYWLASALGFHAFALWVQLERHSRWRAVLFVPLSFAIWTCHVYGWAIFSILIGSYEVSRALKSTNGAMLRSLVNAAMRIWPLMPVIFAMIIWRSNGQGAETLGWFQLGWKASAIFLTLRDQNKLLDVASLIAACWFIYFGIRDKRAQFDPRFGIAALSLAVALLVIPYQLVGSAFADARIYPFLFIVTILSIRMPPDAAGKSLAHPIAIFFSALFTLRIAVSAIGYHEYDLSYKRHLQALDHVERGASVAVLVGTPCRQTWRLPRVEHLGSFALLRRDAFVNSQWDVPGAELLRPKHARGTEFNADPSQFLVDPDCHPDLRPVLAKRIAAVPRQYFNYIWAFNFDPATLPPYNHITPVYRDEATVLYHIDKH